MRQLPKITLIDMIIEMERVVLYDNMDGNPSAPVESMRSEILTHIQDFIRYHETRNWVSQRIGRDFDPTDERSNEELLETLTHLILEFRSNPDFV